MSGRPLALLALGILTVAALAHAQGAPGQPPGPAAPAQPGTPSPSPYGAGAAAAPGAAASGAAAAPAPPPRAAAGYGYSDKPRHTGARRSVASKAGGPTATLPGFELLGDGSSRFFVELTKEVQVEEKKAKGSLVYVLKGAHVARWNNVNPLVTVHFNTPATRARLVPSGRDLRLAIELRQNVAPTWKMVAAKEGGGSVLQVDFPKGDYLPAAPPAGPGGAPGTPAAGAGASGSVTPAAPEGKPSSPPTP